MAQALALIFPSKYEGFGLPIAEAMNLGCPVICSKVASLPEVGGDAAVLVDPHDTAAIGQALMRLASDEGLRQDLSQRGLDRACQFTWESAVDRTWAVYHELR